MQNTTPEQGITQSDFSPLDGWAVEHVNCPKGPAHFWFESIEGISEEQSRVFCPFCGEQIDLALHPYWSPYVFHLRDDQDANAVVALGQELHS